ncbi:adenosylhomocysteinase [bacterium]|nr:adenosylhomocysteinase [bacterium]
MPKSIPHDVRSLSLAPAGRRRIEWADHYMPVLALIRDRFAKEKPLRGQTLAACLHITTETANLLRTLQAGGAKVFACASNPLSTQDGVAASLVKDFGIATFAIKGEDNRTYYRHMLAAIDARPTLTMDDGADTVGVLHTKRRELLAGVLGGTEETTTGVIRLRAMAEEGALAYPIVAVNEANTKHMFDNRYGTGQSTLDGILRATNLLIAGSKVVVCGYGWCGRGVAQRVRGLGGHVIVTEIDPLKALEAVMDGFTVLPLKQAARVGDLFITLTGDKHVIDTDHFRLMKSGAIVCNSGHFNVEINIPALQKMSKSHRTVRPMAEEYLTRDGRRIVLLAEGRLINLASAEGHPAMVMDMSFANQALCAEYMVQQHDQLQNKVYDVPRDIDENIAALKLKSMGVRIDTLTAEQRRYLSSWQEGT